jgi:tetratricopeptide (TPR) repeat protein
MDPQEDSRPPGNVEPPSHGARTGEPQSWFPSIGGWRAAASAAPASVGRAHLAAAIVVAVLTYLAYSNATPNALVHDDRFFFPHNRTYAWQDLHRFFVEDTWASTGAPSGVYRPFLLLSIAADQFAHHDLPAAFHRTNVLLHVAATVLLYLFLRALLVAPAAARGAPSDSRRAVVCAAAAALIFGVHPIHTEAVDSIFNRSEMLVTIGMATALWILLRFEPRRRALAWAGTATVYAAALFCRESAATLPFVAALMLLLIGFDGSWAQRLRRLTPILCLAIPLAVYMLLRHNALGSVVGTPPVDAEAAGAGLGWGTRLAATLTMLRESLRMVVWPHPLRTSYIDFDPSGLASAVAVHALCAAAFAVAIWRRVYLVAFGIAAFYLTLLPSTRLFTAKEISVVVAERYVYLPSAFLAVPFAVALWWLAEPSKGGWLWAVGVGGVLCAVLLPMTYRRNAQWHSGEQLFAADFAATGNSDALRLLTGAYLDNAKYARVAELCDRHLRDLADNAKLHNHCASAYVKLQRFADAEAAYRHALAIGGIDSVVHANLGRLYARQGRVPEAQREFALSVETESEPARQHWRRGQAIFFFHADDAERLARAQAEMEAAVRAQPSSKQYAEWLQKVKDARRRVTQSDTARAAPAPAAVADAVPASDISTAARAQLVAKLSDASPDTPAWLVYDARDPAAEAFAKQLAAAFEEAGWSTRRLSAAAFPLRPGLFLLAADEPPSPSATMVANAFDAAELKAKIGTGYRAFAEERRRSQPTWRGIELEPGQDFVIAVGRRATSP